MSNNKTLLIHYETDLTDHKLDYIKNSSKCIKHAQSIHFETCKPFIIFMSIISQNSQQIQEVVVNLEKKKRNLTQLCLTITQHESLLFLSLSQLPEITCSRRAVVRLE